MVLLIIIPMKNGYFIGNINPISRQTQVYEIENSPRNGMMYYHKPLEVLSHWNIQKLWRSIEMMHPLK